MQPQNAVTEPVVLPKVELAPAEPAAAPAPAEIPPPAESNEQPPKINLRSPEYYLNRELTWLAFNRRVLAEAQDRRTPLLERVKFAAIVASTLDEFFMKR